MENICAQRISRIREKMKERGLSAYIIFLGDDHGSEYVGEHFRCVEYISGFDGSAGTVAVFPESAGLWTDGRYFIQAERQLEGTGISLFKSGEKGVPDLEKYLSQKLSEGEKIGYDGFTVTYSYAKKIKDSLAGKNIVFVEDLDFCGELWTDRPEIAHGRIWDLPLEYAGVSRAEKLKHIRQEMEKEKADSHILSALDAIAYVVDGTYKDMIIRQGSCPTTRADIVEVTGLSYKTVDRCLKKLVACGDIIVKGNSFGSVITICNYGVYSNNDSLFGTTEDTANDTTKYTANYTAGDTTHLSNTDNRYLL